MSAGLSRWRPGEPLEPLRALLARGGMLAIPTESSYGLAVDPRDADAVDAVMAVKRRDGRRPFPVVAADLDQIRDLGAHLPTGPAARLTSLWPAALTLLLTTDEQLPAAAGSGRLGVRIPDHEPLRRLLADLGHALTATSANLSGEPPVLDPAALDELLHDVDAMIVDGGVLAGGPPSTVAGWRDGELEVFREGRVPAEQLISFSAPSVEISVEDAP